MPVKQLRMIMNLARKAQNCLLKLFPKAHTKKPIVKSAPPPPKEAHREVSPHPQSKMGSYAHEHRLTDIILVPDRWQTLKYICSTAVRRVSYTDLSTNTCLQFS